MVCGDDVMICEQIIQCVKDAKKKKKYGFVLSFYLRFLCYCCCCSIVVYLYLRIYICLSLCQITLFHIEVMQNANVLDMDLMYKEWDIFFFGFWNVEKLHKILNIRDEMMRLCVCCVALEIESETLSKVKKVISVIVLLY